MSNYYVKYGSTYLKDFGQYHTVWVTNREEALVYKSKAYAEVIAYAVEAEAVEEYNTTESCVS